VGESGNIKSRHFVIEETTDRKAIKYLSAVVLQKNIYKKIIKRRIRESHVGRTATEKSRIRSLGLIRS
jgi:hypothetical protein